MKTQTQMFYDAQRKSADANEVFLFMVENGLTKRELKSCIKKNPKLWERFEKWFDKLPE